MRLTKGAYALDHLERVRRLLGDATALSEQELKSLRTDESPMTSEKERMLLRQYLETTDKAAERSTPLCIPLVNAPDGIVTVVPQRGTSTFGIEADVREGTLAIAWPNTIQLNDSFMAAVAVACCHPACYDDAGRLLPEVWALAEPRLTEVLDKELATRLLNHQPNSEFDPYPATCRRRPSRAG